MASRIYRDSAVDGDEPSQSAEEALREELRERILHHQVTLEELFVDGRNEFIPGERLERMRARVRYRIVRGFVDAVDERRRATDNFIAGSFSAYPQRWSPVDDTLDELWRAICRITRRLRPVVLPDHLPEPYRSLEDPWRNAVCQQASYMLGMQELAELLEHQRRTERGRQDHVERTLWFHEGDGTWQASQSLIDQMDELRRRSANLPKPRRSRRKQDQRNYHGHPSMQGRRRAKQAGNPGSSIGGVR